MLILVLSLGNFAIGMGVFVAIGLLLPIQQHFGLGDPQSGLILTIYAITYAVGSPILVAATGGVSRRTVMLIGLGIFALSAGLLALANSPALLFAARALSALGAGLFTPITAGVAASISAPERQGKALATVFAGLTFAQVLGVPAGTWLGYTFGWQAAFWAVAAISAACMIGILRWVPRDLPFQSSDIRSLGTALRNWRAMLVIFFTAAFLGGIYVVYTYLAPLLETTMGYGRDGITLVLILFGVGAVIGNALGGWLADAVGPRRTLAFLCMAQIVLMPIFSALPLPGSAVAALVILWAVFGWSFVASQQVRVVKVSGKAPSVGLALNAAAIYIGAFIGSAIGAKVIAIWGVPPLGIVGAAVAACALVLLLVSDKLARNG